MRRPNKNPSPRELKQFGALWLLFFTLVGAIIWHRTDSEIVALGIWGTAMAIGVVGFVVPAFMRLVYLGMSYLAFPIGWVVSHVLVALIYYLVLTPIALVLKVAGYDPMERRFDPSMESYWVRQPKAPDPRRYFRQF